jgi:hypothetical protein
MPPVQESLFSFQAVGHEMVIVANKPAQAPEQSAAVHNSDRLQPVRVIHTGEKAKARDIIDIIRILKAVEAEQRPPTTDERQALARFPGFGVVALSIFHDPVCVGGILA